MGSTSQRSRLAALLVAVATVGSAAPALAGPLERIAQQARLVRRLRDRVQQA